MPGHRNPFTTMSFFEHVHNAVSRVRSGGPASEASAFAQEHEVETKYVDLSIQFIGASGLPKMDVVGSGDPYFVAELDGKIKYMCVSCFILLRLPSIVSDWLFDSN